MGCCISIGLLIVLVAMRKTASTTDHRHRGQIRRYPEDRCTLGSHYASYKVSLISARWIASQSFHFIPFANSSGVARPVTHPLSEETCNIYNENKQFILVAYRTKKTEMVWAIVLDIRINGKKILKWTSQSKKPPLGDSYHERMKWGKLWNEES